MNLYGYLPLRPKQSLSPIPAHPFYDCIISSWLNHTKYEIKGIKLLDFKDFCEAAKIVIEGIHTTFEGLEKIRTIKSRMNKARYILNVYRDFSLIGKTCDF